MPEAPTVGHDLARPSEGENPGAVVLNDNWTKIDTRLLGVGVSFPAKYPVSGLFMRTDQGGKVYENTGTEDTPSFTLRLDPVGVGAHGPSHENGGSDEFSVTGLSGLLADPQVPSAHGHVPANISPQGSSSGLDADLLDGKHLNEIDHDTLVNFFIEQHRIINDVGSSATELFSAQKILALFSVATQIAKGTYTGDGSTGQSITGLGIAPIHVHILNRITVDDTAQKKFETTPEIVAANAAGGAFEHRSSLFKTDTIISLDSDGFTVDDGGSDSDPNKSETLYDFIAYGF